MVVSPTRNIHEPRRPASFNLARFGARKIFANAQMGPREVKAFYRIGAEGERLLEAAVTKLGLSALGFF